MRPLGAGLENVHFLEYTFVLAQRIRADIHVLESELESPEHLRSPPRPFNSPSSISPCLKGLPSPAPLGFTPVPSRKSICSNCDAEMTPDHQCDSDEQRFTKYLMRWSQRLEERTDDSALKSRLLESLVDAYHTPELTSWHTPVSALDLKAVKNQFLEGDLPPVQFLEELQSLLRCSE